jgi:hypothetical protein
MVIVPAYRRTEAKLLSYDVRGGSRPTSPSCQSWCEGDKAMKLATIEAYARPIVVAAGCLLLLLGVYKLAGWWGLVTALGGILLLLGALG